MEKKLYKAKQNKMIDGVCAGLGVYLGLDATVVRLLWVLLTFFGGSGLLAYIVCAVIIPREPDCIENNQGV